VRRRRIVAESAAVAGHQRAWEPSSVAKWKTTGSDEPSRTEIPPRLSDLLRLPAGAVDLSAVATGATPRFTGSGKADAKAAVRHLGARLADLQEQLFAEGHAEGHTAGRRSLLLVLQGMDTAGKGGTVEHVLGLMNPMGVQYHAFKKPTIEEREQHFLWRVKRRLPAPGIVCVFDRSHYEDVVVVRVHELVPAEMWSCRYSVINRFEEKLVGSGTRIVKCFLHISMEEQKRRLIARLDDPTKRWKYDPGDVAERAYWGEYQRAYSDALKECNTEAAPWYVVPADHKWYRNWAITHILAEQLEEMALAWPTPDGWELAEEHARLTADP
jgi:PPK2 family polyphosphate:nucleotide phosphotransferase